MDDRAAWEGKVIAGRFRVERVIGQGGMGVVLRAVHLGLGTRVAVKVLRHPGRGIARFRREATFAARLAGEHVVRVTDAGETEDGTPFLVMELVTGETLAAELARRGSLPIGEAVDIALDTCEALAEAHALGVVHRDVKPSNLLLAEQKDGTRVVKVADFGVAKGDDEDATLTAGGAALGSPSYMAPEQIDDPHGVDGRSDLWAIGVLLFEMLAARRPFDGPTVAATLRRVGEADAPDLTASRPDVPAALAAIVSKCLEKSPSARFSSAVELADALQPFAGKVDAERLVRVRHLAAEPGERREITTLDPDLPIQSTMTAAATSREALVDARDAPKLVKSPLRAGLVVLALGGAGLAAALALRPPTGAPARVEAAAPTPSTSLAPEASSVAAGETAVASAAPTASASPSARPGTPRTPRAGATASVRSAEPAAPPPLPKTELDGLGPRR